MPTYINPSYSDLCYNQKQAMPTYINPSYSDLCYNQKQAMPCNITPFAIESDCDSSPKLNSMINQLFEQLIIRKEMVLTTLIEQIEKRKATKDDFKNIELHSFSSIPYEASKFSVEIVKYHNVKLGYLTVSRDGFVSFDPGFGFEKSNQ